jgi:thiamine biosynthesis lipoprotein
LGGDLRACGEPPDGDGWPVPVEHPCDASRVAFVHALVDGGLVTSTTRIRAWARRGHPMHHIIDPRSGAPTTNGTAAVVVAGPTAWFSEGIAKAMIVLGVEDGSALARRAQVDAWHFLDDGSILPVTPFGP